jgi:hypothetical protein
VNGTVSAADPISAEAIDHRLHAERLEPGRTKRTFQATLHDLPDGVFVIREGRENQALLLQGRSLLVWSPGGYRARMPRMAREPVRVLTPYCIVEAIRAGFEPQIHMSSSVV